MTETPKNSKPEKPTTRSMVAKIVEMMGGKRVSFGPETVSSETSVARSLNTRALLKKRLRGSQN